MTAHTHIHSQTYTRVLLVGVVAGLSRPGRDFGVTSNSITAVKNKKQQAPK